MVVDPADNIWIANVNLSQQSVTSTDLADPVTISQFSAGTSSFGQALSPTQGYGTDPNVCTNSTATYLLIDSSGSLWVDAGLTESYQGYTYCIGGITTFVGLASPNKTPGTGPPQLP